MEPLKAGESCEKSRDEAFTQRAKTHICKEVPAEDNPFLAKKVLWHGYDVCNLMAHRDYVDIVFLLLTGDLPKNDDEKDLFREILIFLANPGPRHPATRAVMSIGVSKTRHSQLLPVGLTLMGGEHMGSSDVTAAMQFFIDHRSQDPAKVAYDALRDARKNGCLSGSIPGFGERFGGQDPIVESVASMLVERHPMCQSVRWGCEFVANGLSENSVGWLKSGLAAAVFVDLGFSPEVGSGIFQGAAWPGLLAHGAEMLNQPLTAMPFVTDENYHFQGDDDAS